MTALCRSVFSPKGGNLINRFLNTDCVLDNYSYSFEYKGVSVQLLFRADVPDDTLKNVKQMILEAYAERMER